MFYEGHEQALEKVVGSPSEFHIMIKFIFWDPLRLWVHRGIAVIYLIYEGSGCTRIELGYLICF